MSDIRLAFIGVGNMGQAAHLRNYLTLPDCRVTALAEIRPRLGAEVAMRYGIPNVYENYAELLDREDVDGIVAIQQCHVHVHMVPDLLQKGVPLLTEKPMAPNLTDGARILAAVREASAPLFLAYHRRSDLAVVYAKNLIDTWKATGSQGSLRYVRVTIPHGDWILNGFDLNLQSNENIEGPGGTWPDDPKGVFVNVYSHQINLMRHLAGQDFELLYADPIGRTMTLKSENGAIGLLEMEPYHTTREWQEAALIGFDRGVIRISIAPPMAIDRAGEVEVFYETEDGPVTIRPSLPPRHAMRCQAENFLRAIRGEWHPLCGAEEAFRDIQIAMQYLELRDAGRG